MLSFGSFGAIWFGERRMLTIGLPGFLAFVFYSIIFNLLWRLSAGFLVQRNPDSQLARAMMFVS